MTRLTPDLIKGVPNDDLNLDSKLLKATGKTVKGLQLDAAGLQEGDLDMASIKVVVVPITSGLGVISGFSESVNSIVQRLGMDSRFTTKTDVTGFSEGVEEGADIIMMADDIRFIAYNTRVNSFIDNWTGTALGYSVALKNAAGGLEGKDVLVIGQGMVGSRAIKFLKGMGANVTVTDILKDKARKVAQELEVGCDVDVIGAISSHTLLINAAPAIFPGSVIAEGSIFSAPGVPHYFDEEAQRKCKAIIHDPLEIGTATMAVCSAALGLKG